MLDFDLKIRSGQVCPKDIQISNERNIFVLYFAYSSMTSYILSLKPHNRKVVWPQSSSTVCHVIHQALMMVIRNQFGTTVESCQSIMFNVVIHMKREKERLAMIYDTRMAYNVIINNRFVKFQPSINVQLGIYYLDQFCLSKKQLSQLTDS